MPRPRFSDWIIPLDSSSIDADGTKEIELDLVDTYYPQIFYRLTWASTDSTTGISIKVYRGYPDGSGGIAYTDAGDIVTINSQPSPSDIDQTTKNDFAMDPELYPRHVKAVFTNLDAVNPCTLFMSGDR